MRSNRSDIACAFFAAITIDWECDVMFVIHIIWKRNSIYWQNGRIREKVSRENLTITH